MHIRASSRAGNMKANNEIILCILITLAILICDYTILLAE